MKKKYTQSQIERALNKLAKGKTFKEVAADTGINIHTLKYYDRLAQGKIAKNVKTETKAPKAPRTITRKAAIRVAESSSTSFPRDLARQVSNFVVSDLRQIFRA